MKRFKIIYPLLISILLFCCFGCGSGDSNNKENKKAEVSKENLEKQSVTLDGTFCVGKYDAEVFTIDFSEHKKLLDGATVEKATIDGREFQACSYEKGILTLDSMTLEELGKKVITAVFISDTTMTTVTVNVDVYTMVINDVDELNKLSSVITTNHGEGHYILGNDIVCDTVYVGGNSETFIGTFDGRGHTIYNFTTESKNTKDRGLFGEQFGVNQKGDNGVLKNISFVNATHSGMGGMIAAQASGIFENVYISVDIVPSTYQGTDHSATAVLGAGSYGNLSVDKVFIEYINPLPSDSETGYAIHRLHSRYGSYKGLYVVGASKVMGYVGTTGSKGEDIYGAYMTYDDFLANGPDLSAWEGDFWTVKDGVPYPRNLDK